jgi:hypothetical protein
MNRNGRTDKQIKHFSLHNYITDLNMNVYFLQSNCFKVHTYRPPPPPGLKQREYTYSEYYVPKEKLPGLLYSQCLHIRITVMVRRWLGYYNNNDIAS